MSTAHPITPPKQFSHQSSPVKKGRFYAGHKLEQVQHYGYQKETHRKKDFKNADELFKFLGTPTFDKLPKVLLSATLSRSDFLKKANTMSKSIQKEYFPGPPNLRVVFKNTENKVPRKHVTDTMCRPDITAAFVEDFSTTDTTYWARIRMAGEWASKGTPPVDQETKAISYLHYLLLARPDLYVAQGMLASEDSMLFLVGIGGFGVRRLRIRWDDKELPKLLYAFIYRTYDPDHFADPSYKLDPTVDENGQPTWTITIGVKSQVDGVTTERPVPCPNFLPLYASSPFETRTHVFATQGEGVDVDGKKLTVIKDQVCRIGTRFDEHEILELVHKPKRVPGVVEAVYHKSIKLPSQLDDLKVGRVKRRHGLRQLGSPFASIPTVKEMLKAAFDIVEVLRFLRAKRHILHRDISIGNVMYAPASEDTQDPNTSAQDDEVLLFSESFLSDSPTQTTSVLLVDFNHAEHLTGKIDGHHERVERTGTALFMARAVELGQPVAVADFLYPIPSAPEPYANHHHDRLQTFPPTSNLELFTPPVDSTPQAWRHELDHDIESVFWLMLYWAMTAQPEDAAAPPEDAAAPPPEDAAAPPPEDAAAPPPEDAAAPPPEDEAAPPPEDEATPPLEDAAAPPPEGEATEYIGAPVWQCLTGGVRARQMLLSGHLGGQIAEESFHSTFRPISTLFKDLAKILSSVDRHWLQASEKRNNPEYFAEAFQRLILQFLMDHQDDDDNGNSFMNQTIDLNPRKIEPQSIQVPRSSTTNQRSHAASQGKRASNTAEQPDSKRRRTTQEPQTDWNSEN